MLSVAMILLSLENNVVEMNDRFPLTLHPLPQRGEGKDSLLPLGEGWG
jgi:hypothetical protein